MKELLWITLKIILNLVARIINVHGLKIVLFFSQKRYLEIIDKGNILIVPKSYLRPEMYIDQIEELLVKNYNSVSCIYFDFLIKNGTRNRYYKASVLNQKISLNSFTKIKANDNLKNLSNSFFAKNFDIVSNSYLTKAQKFFLKKQLLDS